MDRCQTILPPRPPPLTTLRASLGALWFRLSTALLAALRRAARPARRATRLTDGGLQVCTPILTAPIINEGTAPISAQQETPADDRWLRPTAPLPQRG
jgi:hypothetical protein